MLDAGDFYMVRRLSEKEKNQIEKSSRKSSEKDLRSVLGRKPTATEVTIISKHKFQCLAFHEDRLVNFIIIVPSMLAFFVGTCSLMKSFVNAILTHNNILGYAAITIFVFFCFLSSVSYLIHITIGGKSRKLRKMAKNNSCDVIDLKPIGFWKMYGAMTESGPGQDKVEVVFELNDKIYSMEAEGCPVIQDIIPSNHEILLKFKVNTYFGLKTEYAYLVFTYK